MAAVQQNRLYNSITLLNISITISGQHLFREKIIG